MSIFSTLASMRLRPGPLVTFIVSSGPAPDTSGNIVARVPAPDWLTQTRGWKPGNSDTETRDW